MISKDVIQSVIELARIEDVISDFISLRKRGINYIGLCPFHNEKTPSFNVSPTKGIYKCFGCGKAGNVIGFVMEHEKFTYPEAIRYLAGKYHIDIIEEETTADQIADNNEKESLYNIHTFAQKFFSTYLFESQEGKSIGLTYFSEREFSLDVIKKFQLGHCSSAWNDFTAYALKNGYSVQALVKSGLTIEKDHEYYDRFRGRVIFPIHNLSGKVIGFGGRILKHDPSKPKYVNSPESEIYNKSRILYGIYQARNSIVSLNECLLVEGYTDVISLHQAGITNVVASSGTSLTADQVKLLRRFTKNIVILFDGDEAGLRASFRGIDIILEQGLNVKIVVFPAGEDPDSFARKQRPEELKDFIVRNARSFITVKAQLLVDEVKNDPIKKAGLIHEVLSSVAIIPDGIIRSNYLKDCSNLLSIEEEVLLFELNKLLRARHKGAYRPADISEPEPAPPSATQIPTRKIESMFVSDTQEKAIIRLLFLYGSHDIYFDQPDEYQKMRKVACNVAGFIVNDIISDEIKFDNPLYQSFFDEFALMWAKQEVPDIYHFTSHSDPAIRRASMEFTDLEYELSNNWKKNRIYVNGEEKRLKEAVTSSLLSLKAKKLSQMIKQRQATIKEMKDDSALIALLKDIKQLKERLVEINKQLGRIITPG